MLDRKPVSDETKKKISEALRKNFGTPAVPQSAAASAYMNKFIDKKVEWTDIKIERDDLLAKAKALGTGGTTRAARTALKKQIKAANAKMSVLSKGMTAIRSQAMGEKAKSNASLFTKKAEARIKQYDAVTSNITNLLVRTVDPERKARLQERLNRALTAKTALEGRMSGAKDIASGKAKPAAIDKTFSFEEHLHFLDSQDYDPYREITMFEKRVNFEKLNDQFNKQQGELGDEIIGMTNAELDRLTYQAESKLKAGDILWISSLAFLFRSKIADLIRGSIKGAYETGKSMAVSEMGAGGRGGVTPLLDTQLMNVDAADIAEAYVAALEGVAKDALKSGTASEASVSATVSAMRTGVQDEASRAITNITGTVVGQYINRGRDMVFTSNLTKIVSFQRSEVLDGTTCAMCLSLDQLVITPDDPMRNLEIVHTHCRGLWVPIFTQDEDQPDVTGISRSITDKFDTIDGRPVVNAFKNIKKPINDVSKGAQAEIRKRLK